jgi:hypothetical protein
MANARHNPDYGTPRLAKWNAPLVWGVVLIALSVAAFLSVALMWGVGATLWGPLPAWAFAATFCVLVGTIPTGAVGLALSIAGIIRRRRVEAIK